MSSIDDDPTPPQGTRLPSQDPGPRPSSVSISPSFREERVDHTSGALAGLTVTLVVHLTVALASMRLGGREGNVAVQRPTRAQEQVIETHLMKRGGGDFDPRRVVHRQTPVLAEREAPRQVALTRDPTAVQLRPDAGAEDYVNAIVTGRRRAARGNQDLAELERIAQMAAAEQANDPTAPPGPGDPTGSTAGDTTDPQQATRGAATRIDEFLRQHIRVTTVLTGSERSAVTFRIRLDATGAIESASLANASGNDALDADILSQAQGLAERHARIESLSPEELASVTGRNVNVRVPISRMEH
jgi:hypothetical protein